MEQQKDHNVFVTHYFVHTVSILLIVYIPTPLCIYTARQAMYIYTNTEVRS